MTSSLWEFLYEIYSQNDYPGKIPEKGLVHLQYDGKEKLRADLCTHTDTLSTIFLQVYRTGDYLSVKKRYYMVPIPILYFKYDAAKVVLSVDKDGLLDVKLGTANYLWIILAAGDTYLVQRKFQRLKTGPH